VEDSPPAPRSRRDRRGRGLRGPAALGHPATGRPPRPRSRREWFDQLVLDVVTDLDERWSDHLGLVEYAVEDTPQLPDDWESGSVPLSSLVRGTGGTPTRLVVFRRPLEHRAADRAELEAMVLTVLVEQVAELLGIPPSDVDPRYPADLA
jgi:predicted Zn-dependent protease with MMP-like domain